MKNAIALFSEPSEAEKAVKMLDDAGLDVQQARIHSRTTIESNTKIRATPSANTAMGAGVGPTADGAGLTGTVPGAVLSDSTIATYLRDVGIEGDQLPFYRQGIKEGGRIVVVSVPGNDVEKAAAVLAEAGGRVPTGE